MRKGRRLLIVHRLLNRHGGVFVSSSQQMVSSLEDVLEQQRQPRTGLRYSILLVGDQQKLYLKYK